MQARVAAAAAAVLVAVLPIADARGPGAAAATAPSVDPAFLATFVAELNAFRASQGLPPMTASLALSQLALQHSVDMLEEGYFDHTSPSGVAFEARVGAVFSQEGLRPWIASENLASFGGPPTPQELLDGWLGSEAHRANLLATDTPFIGVGVASADAAPGVWEGSGPVTVVTSIQGPGQPDLGNTVLLVVVTPPVLIRTPGSSRFVLVKGSALAPAGTEVDTTHGRVRLTSAADGEGDLQTADFYTGRFVVDYVREPPSPEAPAGWITDLRLSAPVPVCVKKAARSLLAPAKKAPPRQRQLWGSGKGHFRTEGLYASATVRGTTWLVRDTCAGTFVQVTSGVVDVFDVARNRHVSVPAGQSYLVRRGP